jgi:hypothetical protein
MPLATITDVQTRLMRPLSTVEQTAATALIAELSGEVRVRVLGVDARAALDSSYAALVAGRIAGAVARVLRNPEGLVEETVGGETSRWAPDGAGVGLYLSEDDWAVIAVPAVAVGGAFTVSLWG